MHTSLSKKLLAGLLSLVMVLSLVAPGTSAQAATKYSLTDKKSVKSGVTFKYQLKGVSKGCYVKVTRNVSGEKVVYNKKELTKTTKVNGTGKTLNLYVTYGEKDENYTGKFTVKVYGKKTNKLYKTLVEEVTVKVPEKEEPEEPTPEEPVVEEATLVSLEATHVKELTATLSKEVAGLTEKDFTVKKGTVKVTPASVKVEGTKVVIALGSKIAEGTYSVTYKESTVEVKTEDEKLTGLVTVGDAFAETTTSKTNGAALSNLAGANGTYNSSEKIATIEYKAINQYGDEMAAEINNVTSTFGGFAEWTEPTAKKPGKITIYNINTSLGIVGTAGKIIIVSKNGVTTSNDVKYSETSKVAKVELVGIYNTNTNEFVDAIAGQSAIDNYVLVIKAYDQYTNEIAYADYANKMYQSISAAAVLTNVKVKNVVNGKLTADSFTEVSINNEDEVALVLDTDTVNGSAKTVAGTLQLILVGDRFGSVMNETITVSQIDLVKSFTITAPEGIYNNDKNVLEYSCIDVNGKEIKKYDDLKALVKFDVSSKLAWEKNSKGEGVLTYSPTYASFNNNDNDKETTVMSETITCNAAISAADTVVTTKTFTVKEDKMPKSIVKFNGVVATSKNFIDLEKADFVFEDQYGNTLTSADACYGSITYDYKYGANAATTGTGDLRLPVSTTNTKLYISIENQSDDANHNFDKNKAQLVLNLSKVNTNKASNLTVKWSKGLAAQQYVEPNQITSGVKASYFKVTGTVNGKKVTIPSSQYTIKTDSYTPISASEWETAVKTAKVVLTVQLTDADNEQYTEELECEYTYSAAPSKFTAVYAVNADFYASDSYMKMGAHTANMITYDELSNLFMVVDQYGDGYECPLTLEVSLGNHTDGWKVVNNNSTKAFVDYTNKTDVPNTPTGTYSEMTVVATLANGMQAEQKVIVNAVAEANIYSTFNTAVGLFVTAYDAYADSEKTTENVTTFLAAYDTFNTAVQTFVTKGGQLELSDYATKTDLNKEGISVGMMMDEAYDLYIAAAESAIQDLYDAVEDFKDNLGDAEKYAAINTKKTAADTAISKLGTDCEDEASNYTLYVESVAYATKLAADLTADKAAVAAVMAAEKTYADEAALVKALVDSASKGTLVSITVKTKAEKKLTIEYVDGAEIDLTGTNLTITGGLSENSVQIYPAP